MPVISTASLKKGSQTVLGAYRGATPAYNARSFYRDFAQLKTLNHGVGPNINFTRGSQATYFDANGVLQTASTDVPRFDHSGGSSLGLLIEEARTNLLASSKTFSGFSGGGWTSVTDDHSASPDGTTTASLFEWSAVANSYKLASTTVTNIAAATYTTTAFVKPVSGTGVIGVRVGRNDGSQFVESQLNLQTNANTSLTVGADVSGAVVSAQSVGNGWYRLSATGTFSNSYANFGANINAASGSGSCLAWGVQLEAGAFPTSYIPTTSAAVTRNADLAIVNPVTSFVNQSQGTLFSEFRTGAGFPVAAAFVLDADAIGDRVGIFASGATQVAINNVFTSVGSFSPTPNTIFKAILGYEAFNHASSINGQTAQGNTSVGVPINLSYLRIGCEGGLGFTSAQLCGHIRKIAYYPKRLSNALLQSLTT